MYHISDMKNSINGHRCSLTTYLIVGLGLTLRWISMSSGLELSPDLSIRVPGNINAATVLERLKPYHELAPDAYSDPVSSN